MREASQPATPERQDPTPRHVFFGGIYSDQLRSAMRKSHEARTVQINAVTGGQGRKTCN